MLACRDSPSKAGAGAFGARPGGRVGVGFRDRSQSGRGGTGLIERQSRAAGGPIHGWALAALLLAALLVRLPSLGAAAGSYRLTEALRGEEAESVRISTGMLHKHSLNPHAFEYPSLFYYLSLAPEALAARGGGSSWSAALKGVRLLSLAFSLGTLLAVAALARRLAGDAAGLFAAAIVAFDRTLIDLSTFAKPNATQVCFVVLAFVVLVALAARPRVATATLAAALLALAAATKWLGALGLAALALAPLLAHPTAAPPGLRRVIGSIRVALSIRVPAWQVLLPPIAFALVALLCVPYALLSPREFGFGLAQVLTAQSVHQRVLPMWMPAMFLARSLGPVAALAAALGLVWGLARLARWDGSPQDRGALLVLGWAVGYGLLLTLVFVRLPGYVDLWVPFVAVLAGAAVTGDRGLVRAPAARWVAIAVVAVAGAAAGGVGALAHARLEREFDTRVAAGDWLAQAAADSDAVLADLGAFVPDRLTRVEWNAWGSPPRLIYDETRTWGSDPVWPDWTGGHRQLLFVNARWRPASERLAAHPRWVVVSDEWTEVRAHPSYAAEAADPGYDRALADGSAGYVKRAEFVPTPAPRNPWHVLSLEKRTRDSGPYFSGPSIAIYQRIAGPARH